MFSKPVAHPFSVTDTDPAEDTERPIFSWCSLTAKLWNKPTAHTQEPLEQEKRESLIKTGIKRTSTQPQINLIKSTGFFFLLVRAFMSVMWKYVRAVKSRVKQLLETITPAIRTSCGFGKGYETVPLTPGIRNQTRDDWSMMENPEGIIVKWFHTFITALFNPH